VPIASGVVYVVLVLALIGGFILAATIVFEVNDGLVAVGWLAWLGSVALLVLATMVGARRGGSSLGGSVRHGARATWEWLKAFTP